MSLIGIFGLHRANTTKDQQRHEASSNQVLDLGAVRICANLIAREVVADPVILGKAHAVSKLIENYPQDVIIRFNGLGDMEVYPTDGATYRLK